MRDGTATMLPCYALSGNGAADYDSERGLGTQLLNVALNAIVPNVRGQGKKGQECMGSMRITSLYMT